MIMSVSCLFSKFVAALERAAGRVCRCGMRPVYFGRHVSNVPDGALVVFPVRSTLLGCGIAGIVAFKCPRPSPTEAPLAQLADLAQRVCRSGPAGDASPPERSVADYLGGEACIEALWRQVHALKRANIFTRLCGDETLQSEMDRLARALAEHAETEGRQFDDAMGRLNAADADVMALRIDRLRDIAWCLRAEILANIAKVRGLMNGVAAPPAVEAVAVFRNLNAVLNSIDRLEVAGRRFPFGGRCSLYENVWKRGSRQAPAPDRTRPTTATRHLSSRPPICRCAAGPPASSGSAPMGRSPSHPAQTWLRASSTSACRRRSPPSAWSGNVPRHRW